MERTRKRGRTGYVEEGRREEGTHRRGRTCRRGRRRGRREHIGEGGGDIQEREAAEGHKRRVHVDGLILCTSRGNTIMSYLLNCVYPINEHN